MDRDARAPDRIEQQRKASEEGAVTGGFVIHETQSSPTDERGVTHCKRAFANVC